MLKIHEEWNGDTWGSGSSSTYFNDNDTVTNSSNNITLNCAARNIQGPIELPYTTALTTTVRALLFIYYFFVVLCGSSLNLLVIVLVAKYKKLQTYSVVIALQIVILDFLLSLNFVNILITSIANRWVFGEHFCAINGFFLLSSYLVRSFLMLVFVIDRFLLVFFPFSYPKHQLGITVSLFLASWLTGEAISIIFLPNIMDCYAFAQDFLLCGLGPTCSDQCSYISHIVLSITGVPVTVLPVILYIILYIKAKKARKTMEITEKIQSEWKATVTFFLLFLTVFLLLLPNSALTLAISFLYRSRTRPPFIYILSLVAGSSTHLLLVIDPIVILRNGNVREIIAEIKAKMRNSSPAENKLMWNAIYSSTLSYINIVVQCVCLMSTHTFIFKALNF